MPIELALTFTEYLFSFNLIEISPDAKGTPLTKEEIKSFSLIGKENKYLLNIKKHKNNKTDMYNFLFLYSI